MKLSPLNRTIDFRNSPQKEINEIYRSWVKYLITKTRDTKKYSLLFSENISYGFRRNLWGLKPFSIFLIVTTIISNYFYQIINNDFKSLLPILLDFVVSELILFVLCIIWVFIINKSWIKIPAFAYAERLLETIDTLERESETP